jgi:hypothetical protein
MRLLYWLPTLAVAFTSYWLLSQYVNVLVAGIITAWISCLPALFGVIANDGETARRIDENRSEPAE